MEPSNHITIYECFDQSGDPSHYICWGHVDSERFRDECFKEYSIRPLVVQHQWQCTRRVLVKESEKKKSRGKFDNIQCSENAQNANAITIGVAPKGESDPEVAEIDIN